MSLFFFYPDFLGHTGKQFDKKVTVNFKTYDFTDWEQIITIHILPNISRSKAKQTMKFGQLIAYNMKNIFLEKSYTNRLVEKLFPDSCPNPIEHISGSTCWKVIQFVFVVCPSHGPPKYIKTKRLTTSFYLKAFLKNKERSGPSVPASFSAWSLNKHISNITFYWLTKFHYLIAFTFWDIR